MQIQISRFLKKLTNLDLHCLQRQGISGLSRTRVNHVMLKGPNLPKLIGQTDLGKKSIDQILHSAAIDQGLLCLLFNHHILNFNPCPGE